MQRYSLPALLRRRFGVDASAQSFEMKGQGVPFLSRIRLSSLLHLNRLNNITRNIWQKTYKFSILQYLNFAGVA